MSEEKISAGGLTPILYARDFQEALDYYTKILLFDLEWDWGEPPSFGCVRLDEIRIFICHQGQGHPGTWLSIFMEDVDGYHRKISALGAEIVAGPRDEPWGCRELLVRDPNDHVIRFSENIPIREPKIEIDRKSLTLRLEERLLALVEDLAAHKQMTVGEMFEEILLHSFEEVSEGGVASPHNKATLSHIQELRDKHGIDYDTHASYRFVDRKDG